MTRTDNDKPVVLSKIYTRTGDDGTTNLGDMSRTRKTDMRLAAYADVEEANAAIGLALAFARAAEGPDHGEAGRGAGGDQGEGQAGAGIGDDVRAVLERVQNELFDVGADLACPVVAEPEFPPLRVEESYITWLEARCDEFNQRLKPLRSFILPGGTPAVAQLHVARTIVRRAERTAWAATEAHDDVNPLTVKYLNRLSDLLFILCRIAAHGDEILWKPGATR
ncbi:cob(I)alamin adenosyltransferase [Thermocatellispora tengchongensis]|uniref:Corrinoid adenosyltransferase n=1 Tax=Thermocatellispora tengchongensis TaxID=1073253 RepID=A0A840PLU2_9ACTN|nr:cob(I)yrinic acid a,c-diamide adenosyltransferase [Thermocatellispora tengchongensis]MBB5138017.1 cob(I)alamin adenosyltransferase [Thermocatellispora tengchongensis]